MCILRKILTLITITLGLAVSLEARAEESLAKESQGHMINFGDVPVSELIKFVSKIAKKTFIFKVEDLDFKVSYISGKPCTSHTILQALYQILEQHHFKIKETEDYIVIEKLSEGEIKSKVNKLLDLKTAALDGYQPQDTLKNHGEFFIYKLQYNKGVDILKAVKQLSLSKKDLNTPMQNAIESLQWMEPTNSLVFSSSHDTAYELHRLIKSLDTPQKQVFIEVLVIETDAKEAAEFGLEWGGSGKIKDKLGFGVGNFPATPGNILANSLQNMSSTSTPTGASQIPFGRGFDLGVIGDIILHKGRSFLSLGSLISALEKDGKVSVVLNQKILTQDNKSSSIFVGDNIPFTGSIIQTIGASQQTTANIEYRDVGVSLNITPLLGESDIITLEIDEEITEARDDLREFDNRVNGIQTTKTNMTTRVHVPDQHFLVLSGMVKNSRTFRKTGIPCLGSIPWLGVLFSKTKVDKEKKNILVFVKPQIIHSVDMHQKLTDNQERHYNTLFDKKEQIDFNQLSQD